MNTPLSRDEELDRLLQSWRVDSCDDPALARKVWARLEAQKSCGASAWFDSLVRLFARPAGAVAAIVLFTVVGALAAEWQETARREARLDRLATEYAYSIDPLLMTHAGGAAHSP